MIRGVSGGFKWNSYNSRTATVLLHVCWLVIRGGLNELHDSNQKLWKNRFKVVNVTFQNLVVGPNSHNWSMIEIVGLNLHLGATLGLLSFDRLGLVGPTNQLAQKQHTWSLIWVAEFLKIARKSLSFDCFTSESICNDCWVSKHLEFANGTLYFTIFTSLSIWVIPLSSNFLELDQNP